MQLRDYAKISGLKTKGKITDSRLRLITKVIDLKFGKQANSYQFMSDKIKEIFNVDVSTGRLHVFYVHQQEIEDRKLIQKHAV